MASDSRVAASRQHRSGSSPWDSGGAGASGGGAASNPFVRRPKAEGRAAKPPLSQKVPFVDKVLVRAEGGHGGDGCAAFVPAGRGQKLVANGGNGGHGGDIVLHATRRVASLRGIPTLLRAAAGGRGTSQGCAGASGAALVVEVPLGTLVKKVPDRDGGSEDGSTEGKAGDGVTASVAAASQGGGGASRAHGDAARATRAVRRGLWATPVGAAAAEAAEAAAPMPVAAVDVVRSAGDGAGEAGQQGSGAEAGGGDYIEEVPWDSDDDDEEEGSDGDSGDDGEEEDGDADEEARRRRRAVRRRRRREEVEAAAVVVADLVVEGQQVVIAAGGRGGRGNKQAQAQPGMAPPSEYEHGAPGSSGVLILEAKVLADVGFVGLPNAGKSTLLNALTAARAQVGSYAFTTLRPQLGTLQYADGLALVAADVPGLLRGAHANKGRGNQFLRHIEQCRCLVYVVDLSGGCAGALVPQWPWEQLQILMDELRRYRGELLDAPALVVANKVDALAQPRRALAALKARTHLPIVPVSAQHGAGMEALKEAVRAVVMSAPGAAEGAAVAVMLGGCTQ